LNAARKRDDPANLAAATEAYRAAQRGIEGARKSGVALYEKTQAMPGLTTRTTSSSRSLPDIFRRVSSGW